MGQGISQQDNDSAKESMSQLKEVVPLQGVTTPVMSKPASREDQQKLVDTLIRQCAQKVVINMGGHLYTTSMDTLTRVPESKLAKLFLNKEITADAQGVYHIDHTGTYFKYIIEYLRDGDCSTTDDDDGL